MPSNQSATFGGCVVSPADEKAAMLPPSGLDSPVLTPVMSRDFDACRGTKSLSPLSPFYQHIPASHERIETTRPVHSGAARLNSEKDFEYGTATHYSNADEENTFSQKINVFARSQECTVWPTTQMLRRNRAAEKKQHHQGCSICGWEIVKDRWAGCTKWQKLTARMFITLVVIGSIVGVAVGLGFGVH